MILRTAFNLFLVDYETVKEQLRAMAKSMTCDSERDTKVGANHVNAKVRHAVQIITGYHETFDTYINSRWLNWKTFVGYKG